MSWRFFSRPAVPGLAAALLLAGGGLARADIQQTRQRRQPLDRALRNLPPNGVEQPATEVNAGGQVEITLQARGQEGKTIEFIIRDRPAHGTLSDLRLLSRNTAAITYAQDPGDLAERDEFTYAVQARGSVVSAPTTVPIRIVPLPARLVATPAGLDFGAVEVGGASRAQLTLENQGGSPAVGQLMPPAPWVVEGTAEYRLAKGERQTFQLVFTPGFGRVFEDEVVLGNRGGQQVHLVGTGIAKDGAGRRTTATDAAGNPLTPAGAPGAPGPDSANGNPGGRGAAAVAAVGANPPYALPAAPVAPDYGPGGEARGGSVGTPVAANRDPAIFNEAGVIKVERRWNDAHNIKLAWKTPEPAPKTYRVELRQLSIDPDTKRLLIDWRAYAQIEYQPGARETTAILHGLPGATRQTIRVVAVDGRNRAAAPSAWVQVDLPPGADWFRVTPLRVLLLALAGCVVLLIRRKRETRLILSEMTASRASAESFG